MISFLQYCNVRIQGKLILLITPLLSIVLTLTTSFSTVHHSSKGKYPISVSENGRFFIDKNGAPFYYQACTGWMLLSRLDKSETEEYLKNRSLKGFNTIQVTLLPWKSDQTNRYGESPFIDKQPFGKPNEEYFDHVDWVLDKAGEYGIQLAINLFWLRNDWSEYSTIENARTFGEYIANRFIDKENIIWFIGGDTNPGKYIQSQQILAETIHQLDTKHLMSYHGGRFTDGSSTSSSSLFHSEAWHDYNMAYCYDPYHGARKDPYPYVQFIHAWNIKPVKPIILSETFYEEIGYGFKNEEHQLYAIRRSPLWGLTSGITGHAVGHNKIYPFIDGWQKAMDHPNSVFVSNLSRLIEDIEWWKLVPDQYQEVGINGYGNYGGAHYVSVAYDPDGQLAIAYFPKQTSLTVNMAKFSGSVSAKWFDPITGNEIAIEDDIPNHGQYQFTSPIRKNSDYHDFLLILETE